MENIKIGDLVECCSLMPGVVMKIKGDDIEVRRLDFDDYVKDDQFSCCSLKHCGIVKINAEQALRRLVIGKDNLSKLYRAAKSIEEYYNLVDDVKDTPVTSK